MFQNVLKLLIHIFTILQFLIQKSKKKSKSENKIEPIETKLELSLKFYCFFST